MAIATGKSANVYVCATPSVTHTALACTVIDTTHHYITNQDYRYVDWTQAFTVKANSVAKTYLTDYTLDFAGGYINWLITPTPPITIDCYSFPYAKLGQALGWKFQYKPHKHDITLLNDPAARRALGLWDFSMSFKKFHEDNTYFGIVNSDTLIAAALHETGTYNTTNTTGPRFEGYAHWGECKIDANVDDYEREEVMGESELPWYFHTLS